MEKNEKINPLVSVIIPFYNSENTLGKCIESVLNQTYTNIEVILIDNGSRDKGRTLVEKYALSDDRIHMTECCGTVSVARNTGLSKANGKYIQFVDSDDYPEPDAVERLIEAVEKAEKTLVICDYFQFDEEKSDMRNVRPLEGIFSKKQFLRKMLCSPGAHYYGVLWNKIYDTAIVKEKHITFPEEITLGEDFIFNMEYLKHMEAVECLAVKLYHYWWKRKGALSNTQKNEEEAIEERLRLYRAYENLFKYENLFFRYKSFVQYYIVKYYFDELELLGNEAGKYKNLLYQKCIAGTGISRLKFCVFYCLKKVKRYSSIKKANV